ncbi:Pectate lyase L [Colletotrichum tanaceti]|uniref:Pectate lyase L n=1 Tax=Colletotrichum tanaceti TaxID=1306861 RepID=A0A4U6XGA1_9PEZI|nr:Pectate lyase L [Colletotrichum tanaceti]TKW54795.1 Pectate lyase L [Colletotrichum tanaceti]
MSLPAPNCVNPVWRVSLQVLVIIKPDHDHCQQVASFLFWYPSVSPVTLFRFASCKATLTLFSSYTLFILHSFHLTLFSCSYSFRFSFPHSFPLLFSFPQSTSTFFTMLLLSALVSCLPLALTAEIHVAPTGSPTPDGTRSQPFGDIQVAVDMSRPGDVILLGGGTYELLKNINITVNGTAEAPITLRAADDEEEVVIDGEALPDTPAPLRASVPNRNRGVLHVSRARHWTFARLTFIHGAYGVYVRDSSNLRFNQIVTRDNYESGFHMQGELSDNVISYLDSYGNRDPRNNGENADGLAIKEGRGEGNIVVGGRFWDNSDDGVDFWEFHSKLTIKDSIAWGNGFNRWDMVNFTGNGNGFKLGGGSPGEILPAARDVTNCIAFGNAANGFTDNSQTGAFAVEDNTSWMNGRVGFRSVNATGVLKRNVAAANNPTAPANATAGGQATLRGAQTSVGNSWDVAGAGATTPPPLTNASFKSVDVGLVTGPRDKNGKIAPSDFLVLVDGAEMGATTDWK